MPSPKDGTVNNLVTPAAPREALPADDADPGQMAKIEAQQQQSGTGKYGSKPMKPFKKSEKEEDGQDEETKKKKTWIAIKMVDEVDNPVPGMAYKIVLPDGETAAEGTLDDQGYARVDGIDPGTYKITFPDLDQDAWEPK